MRPIELREEGDNEAAPSPEHSRSQRAITACALLGSLLLAAIYGRTALLNLNVGVLGGDVDGYENLWDYYWFKRSIFDLHRSPYFTDYLYYPTGISLRFHTLNPLNGLLTLPFNITIGYIPTINLLFVFALFLSTFFAFLLLRDLIGNPWAAFVGGAIFTFANHNLLGHFGAGQAEKVSTEWLPLYFFFLFRTLHGHPYWLQQSAPNSTEQLLQAPVRVDTNGWRFYAVLTILALFTLTFTDWQYVMFAVFAMLLYFAFTLFTRVTVAEKRRTFIRLAIIGGVYALLAGPTLLLPMVNEASREPWLSLGYQSSVRAIDLSDFVAPGLGNPGYLVYALALIGLWVVFRGRGWARSTILFWALLALIFNIISLGPDLTLNERSTGIPMPYALIQNLPLFNIGRDPGRFNTTATLGLAILAGVGLRLLIIKARVLLEEKRIYVWLAREAGGVVAAVALVIILWGFVSASGDVKMDPPFIPDFYSQIAADKEEYALLELPTFTENGRGENHYMMYQSIHNKPLFGGRWARDHKLTNPDNFMKTASLFHHFFLLDYPNEIGNYYPPQDFLKRTDYTTQGLDILSFYKVRYIILHKDALESDWDEDEFQKVIQAVFGGQVKPVVDDDLITVYAVPPPRSTIAANPLTLDVGNGWFNAETNTSGKVYRWADSSHIQDNQATELYTMNLTKEQVKTTLSFTAFTWKQPRTLKIAVNSVEAATIYLKPEDVEKAYSIELDLPPGNNIITFSSPEPPLPTGYATDLRKLSFGMYGVTLQAQP